MGGGERGGGLDLRKDGGRVEETSVFLIEGGQRDGEKLLTRMTSEYDSIILLCSLLLLLLFLLLPFPLPPTLSHSPRRQFCGVKFDLPAFDVLPRCLVGPNPSLVPSLHRIRSGGSRRPADLARRESQVEIWGIRSRLEVSFQSSKGRVVVRRSARIFDCHRRNQGTAS